MDPTRQATAPTALTETEKELRLASDNFLTRIERLHALEEQKRELPAAEMADMAHEVEALTREILEWAGRQTDLAEEAAALDEGDARPIAIVPPRHSSVILDEWGVPPNDRSRTKSPAPAAYESGRADVDRLRDEYARAYKAQSNH